MSTYRNLRGYNNQNIKNVVPYQTFPASVVNTGQIWYGADNNFYIQKQTATVNSWTVGNNPPITTPVATFSAGACGIQTAALGYGKVLSPAPGFNPTAAAILAESYDGTNWSSITNLNERRSGSGSSNAAPQTATIVFGGSIEVPPATPSTNTISTATRWNGTAWTSINSMPFQKSSLGGTGTSTAALAFGGSLPNATPAPTRQSATAAKYDGTNWTNVNSMAANPIGPIGFNNIVGCGTQTATFAWSGTPIANYQVYDGTNWTNITAFTSAPRRNGGAAGTSTNLIAFGGITGPGSGSSRSNESWNGTSWTTLLDRNVATSSSPGVGSSTTALSASGSFGFQVGPFQSTTEEWSTNLFSSKITAT